MHTDLKPLLDRVTRTRRARCSTITVARIDDRANRPGFSAIVLIDRRQIGHLVGYESRVFQVTDGAHEVRAFLRGGLNVTANVTVAPGQILRLQCGVREEWDQLLRRLSRAFMMLMLCVFVVAALAWSSFPSYREAVATFILRTEPPRSVARVLQILARSLTVWASFWTLTYVVLMLIGFTTYQQRLLLAFRARYGHPCYLVAVSETSAILSCGA